MMGELGLARESQQARIEKGYLRAVFLGLGYLYLGARGLVCCLKKTRSEGPAREPLTVQAPRRLARASTSLLEGRFLEAG
jgi:hypothetical protein